MIGKHVFGTFVVVVLLLVTISSSHAQNQNTGLTCIANVAVEPTIVAEGIGEALVTLALSRDADGFITAGVVRLDTLVAQFPTDSITGMHIHKGPIGGPLGPIAVDAGISPSSAVPISSPFMTLTRTNLSMSAADAVALIDEPSGFYLDIHTSQRPAGAVRCQFDKRTGSALDSVLAGTFTQSATYHPIDPWAWFVALGNLGAPVSADLFAGIALPANQSAAMCPGVGNVSLLFLGPNGTVSQECLSNLGKPGNHAIPLAQNLVIPSLLPPQVFPLVNVVLPPSTPPGTYPTFFCAAGPNTFPSGPLKCDVKTFVVQ